MTAWHLPYALSGQNANLPKGSLTFSPKVDTAKAWSLPFFFPGVMGTISQTSGRGYTLAVKIGRLKLTHLAVDGANTGPVDLVAGQNVTWH